MKEINPDYNSTYISINLLDELDYIIGGYEKPNSIFIYSLNAFLEAFILNSTFYLSVQELKHSQIVSKSIFPNGRPILELLSKTQSLNAIGGIGNEIGQVVALGSFDPKNPKSYQERIKEYIDNGFDTQETREKYLIIPSVDSEIKQIPYLNIGRVEDGYVATVSQNSPQQFYSKFCEVTKNSNIQSTLPFYSYSFQVKEMQSRGIGREIITKLTDSFQEKQNEINNYFGYSNQTIPPLVNILLSQCKNISDIPNKMFQLREDFTQLRESIIRYEARINEADTVKKQLDAIDELNEFWTTFNKKYTKDSRLIYQFWEVAKDSNFEDSLDKAIDSKNASDIIEDLNVGKVAGKGAIKLFDWYKDRKIINRFKGVTDIWKLFQNSPNVKKHISEFERIFDTKLDPRELEKLNIKIRELKLHTITVTVAQASNFPL